MGVERCITVRIVTNLDRFSEIIKVLVNNGFSFSEGGKIVSLAEKDIDEFNYIEYDLFDDVEKVLNKREEAGLNNYVVVWLKDLDESLLVRCTRLDTKYETYESHYELSFDIGYGVRIQGAERFTDFSVYLNRLLPMLMDNSIRICEVNCNDFNC